MNAAGSEKDGRRRAETFGRGAESRAALWLRLKGYRILGRRVRTPAGEIDLVARRGNLLAFVEVKARHGDGAEVLGRRQQARIARAAEAFAATRPDLAGLDWRFDLILVAGPWRLRHIADAWRPDGR